MKLVEIGKLCKLQNGKAFKPTEWSDKGLPIVRIQNLNNEEKPFNYCDFDVDKKFHIDSGDLLFSWSGTPGTSFGAFFWHRGPAILNQHIFNVLIDESLVRKDYFRLAMNAKLDEIIAQAHGGVGLQHITKGKLEAVKIPLPPLETQKQIAAVLEKADQLRKDCQQMEQELNSLAKSVFIDMFGDPVKNPKGWDSSSLEAEMQFLTSGSRGWAKHYDNEGSSIFIRIQNVLKDKLSLNDIQKISPPNTQEAIRTKVKDGDILLSITADLGRACVVRNIESDTYISQHLALIRVKESNIVPEFLSAFLISPAGIGQFEQKNKGGTKAGLNFTDIRSLKILLPPKVLQVKFKQIKEDLDKKSIQLKHTAKVYDDLFDSVMQKAFKGELNR
ncbi:MULTISPECIES: restriction endonuclease subunit S [Vibrio]|uniref:restriction endonuclease subunit S n=1 Tax=Vibrio TaxID=662 RepID=UPI0003102C8B|nr:restriction endonuclease subunit S [Vibrio tasmaniensis]OEF84696.1 hypothetical protein A162_10875 [Vibrio tasmaniensis 1F-155]PMO73653.1 hypothetical protein BCT01_19580 [Vibrio tasmaniensis]